MRRTARFEMMAGEGVFIDRWRDENQIFRNKKSS
jgi:hypothetical protein